MAKTGYVIERLKDRSVVNCYRLLWQAKMALSELCAPNEYRIIAINEYQGYMFEGPHKYYIQHNGKDFVKYNR